jgi:flagellar motor switch protein FliN/FliY
MSTELQSFADDLTAVFCSCARQTLRGALGRACGMTPGERLPGLPAAFPLAIRFTLAEGGKGEISLLLAREAGALLADLMVMGDGGATWAEEHRDALQELGSQLAGAFTTSQTERWSHRLVFRASVGEGAPAPGSCCYPVDLDVQGFPIHAAMLTISQEMMATASGLDRGRASQSDISRTDDFTEGISEAAAPAPTRAPAGGTGSATSWVDSRDPSVQRLLDVPIEVVIELGQTELSIRRILEIGPGSIIELDRMAGEPVDLVVNDKVIARGEVVVIEENFGIRITTLVTPEERARPIK